MISLNNACDKFDISKVKSYDMSINFLFFHVPYNNSMNLNGTGTDSPFLLVVSVSIVFFLLLDMQMDGCDRVRLRCYHLFLLS